jgi:hypothetical protein
MINRNPWFGLVIILIAALGLAACGQEPTYEKIEPAELVDQGDGRNLVILTEKAAERLDIQTETVREESIHLTRTYGGQVSKSSGDSAAMVMVSLTEEEKGMVDTNFPALIIPLEDDDEEDSDEEESGFSAEFDELPGLDDAEDSGTTTLTYFVMDEEANLVDGQRLMIELAMKGGNGPRLVVPFASLLYDIYGETWIYISPEPLQFLRVPVVVDYIEDDLVVLSEGPEVGTKVVTVGVAELHGTDTGVGK